MTNKQIEKIVYDYPCNSGYGFNSLEIKDILSKFPTINMDKWYNAMMCNTGLVDDGEIITYHCDVLKGIICGVENRDLKIYEFD